MIIIMMIFTTMTMKIVRRIRKRIDRSIAAAVVAAAVVVRGTRAKWSGVEWNDLSDDP
jgi:hypothetical protein